MRAVIKAFLRVYGASATIVLASCSSASLAVPSAVAPVGSGPVNETPLARMSIWSVIDSPNAPPGSDGLYDDTLYGVNGDSSNDVWAVGNDCCYTYGSQEYTHALIEHWNGSAWSIVPFPKDEPPDTALHAVAAISKTDAWAVGNSFYPNNQAVIFHWNGKKWSVVSSPYVYNNAELLSIVALSPNNVWAAGEGNYAALLEHWNGKEWSFVPGLTYGGVTVLTSIAATGPNDIMAVGEFFPSTNLSFFAEHWNGSKWTNATPFSTFFQSAFASVTAVSANNYWTVGWEEPNQTNQVPQTLAEHWNGSKFTLVPTPNKEPKSGYLLYNVLAGVVAQSSSDVWSVGTWTYYPGSGTSRSLFERWNGKAWRGEPGPPSLESSNNNTFNQLFGIAKLGSGGLWAVGSQEDPGYGAKTLTVSATHN